MKAENGNEQRRKTEVKDETRKAETLKAEKR
jgi:hypothetical protein